MSARLICIAVIAIFFIAVDAAAQTDVGVQAAGLVSIQPVDESWVGMPYLDKGLGGVGPGIGLGINAVMPNKFTVGAEFTMAWFSEEQEGRLISGSVIGVKEVNTLHDALLSGLIGYTQRGGGTEVRYLAGGGTLLSDRSKTHGPIIPTGGVDVVHALSDRTSFVVTARYAYIPRNDNGTSLAAGPHVIRAGAGIRVKLH